MDFDQFEANAEKALKAMPADFVTDAVALLSKHDLSAFVPTLIAHLRDDVSAIGFEMMVLKTVSQADVEASIRRVLAKMGTDVPNR